MSGEGDAAGPAARAADGPTEERDGTEREETEHVGTEHPGGEHDGTDHAEAERDGTDGDRGIDRDAVVTYLRWGALFAFAMVAVIAGAGLYSSLGSVIDVWVADRYQPIARAGLNLGLLCAAVGGGVATLRRL